MSKVILREDLSKLDFSDVSSGRKHAPITPGKILLEEFLQPMNLTQYRLAKDIGVPQRRIGEIIAGKRGISADTALRLSRYFGMSENFWLALQMDYEREVTKRALAKTLDHIIPFARAA